MRALSDIQRNLLIEHIDGPVAVTRLVPARDRTIRSLLTLRLLRPHPSAGPLSRHPRFTALTEAGRHSVAALLADYAEALVRAGCLEMESGLSPIEILQTMKASPARAMPAVIHSAASKGASS